MLLIHETGVQRRYSTATVIPCQEKKMRGCSIGTIEIHQFVRITTLVVWLLVAPTFHLLKPNLFCKLAQLTGKAGSNLRILMPIPSCRQPEESLQSKTCSSKRCKALLCLAEMVKREYPLTSYADSFKVLYRRLPHCPAIARHSPALHPLH